MSRQHDTSTDKYGHNTIVGDYVVHRWSHLSVARYAVIVSIIPMISRFGDIIRVDVMSEVDSDTEDAIRPMAVIFQSELVRVPRVVIEQQLMSTAEFLIKQEITNGALTDEYFDRLARRYAPTGDNRV